MSKKNNILTAPVVSKALRAGDLCILQDGGSLTLEVTGKNQGKWLYRGRKQGSRTLIKLICGYAPETGLSEARSKRDEYKLLLKQGINPNQQKKQAQEKNKLANEQIKKTFHFVAKEYLATRQDITPKTMQGDTNRLVNHAGPILDLPISDIRRKDHLKPLIDALLQNKSMEQAKRVAGLLGRIFRYAVDCGYIDSSPAERLSSLLPRKTGEKNHHAAQTSEGSCRILFSKIWEYAEDNRSGPFVTGAIKIACYVPLRCSNLRGAKWEDVDLEEGIWRFPKTKNGRAYDLPISRQVKEILSYLHKFTNEDIPFCFPGTTKSGYISDGSLIKYLRNSGITKEEQSLHGFRSTFQSIALEHGIPKVLTERILFHVAGGATEQAYNRTTYLGPTKAVMQWWADAVDAMCDGKQLPDIPEILRLGGAYQ